MKTLILIILIQASSAFANIAPSQKEEIQAVQSELGLKQLTPELIKVILKNPWSIPFLKKSAHRANLFSQKICQVEGEPRHTRDEVDAVRHFVLASLLTYHIGPKFTRAFLTAHEQRAQTYNSENYMDLSNNELGIQFGTALKNKDFDDLYEVFYEEVILRVHTTGDLFVLDSGDSFCGNSQLFPTMWEAQE